MIRRPTLALLALALAACTPEQSIGDDGPREADAAIADADLSGTYTVTLTNAENGCALSNWQVGATANVSISITQTGNALTAIVSDLGGLSISLLTGSNTFQGTVRGNDFSLHMYGTVAGTLMGCPFTWDSTVTGTIATDFISGNVVYTRALNKNPACQSLACASKNLYNGVRPPQTP